MVAHHVEIEQAAIGAEDQAQRQTVTAFVEAASEGTDAGSTMEMRIPKSSAHFLDPFSDALPLLLRRLSQHRHQIGIEFNVESLFRCLR